GAPRSEMVFYEAFARSRPAPVVGRASRPRYDASKFALITSTFDRSLIAAPSRDCRCHDTATRATPQRHLPRPARSNIRFVIWKPHHLQARHMARCLLAALIHSATPPPDRASPIAPRAC